MSDPVKFIIRFFLFLLVQALVLNHMPPLHRFITPYVYFLFLLWLPFSTSRPAMLIWAFMLGFSLDAFTHTPGLHASSALVVAYLRPFLINLMVPKDTRELAVGSPSVRTMGGASYFLFMALLTFVHHTWLVMLEWMTFASFGYFLGKVFASTIVTLLLMLVTELIFRPVSRQKQRN